MTRSHFGRWTCILALTVLFTDLTPAGAREPFVPANRPLTLVASPQKGAALFQNRCATCHTVQAGGPQKFGPPLHGLFGRQAGAVSGYNYSTDMRASRILWDAQTLDRYLADPHRSIPDAGMPYLGLSSKTDRDDIISYLEQATR